MVEGHTEGKRATILENSNIYIMPKERSVDIDDAIDFKIAEVLLKEAKGS